MRNLNGYIIFTYSIENHRGDGNLINEWQNWWRNGMVAIEYVEFLTKNIRDFPYLWIMSSVMLWKLYMIYNFNVSIKKQERGTKRRWFDRT